MEEALRQLEQVIQGSQVWRSRATCGAKERELWPIWVGTQEDVGEVVLGRAVPPEVMHNLELSLMRNAEGLSPDETHEKWLKGLGWREPG